MVLGDAARTHRSSRQIGAVSSTAQGVDSFRRAADDDSSAPDSAAQERVRSSVTIWFSLSFRQSGAAMGIHDREYYRGESKRAGWFGGSSPVCHAIIVINAIVFILQQITDSDFVNAWLAASPETTLRHFRLWELLTATFLHGGPLHILGNMWFLYLVGREMESLYGSRDFLVFYLSAAVFSTLVWVLIDSMAPVPHLMIGASGAVMAVVTLFTLFYPRREILFIFVQMPMWMLLVIYLLFPLVPLLRGNETQVAFESHLAGAAFAVVFKKFNLRWSRLVAGRFARPRLRVLRAPREPSRSRAPSTAWTTSNVAGNSKAAAASVLPEEQLDARLDEVLAKIAREGREGLTEEEQRILQEASRRARLRRSDRL
jgi:membrane associated rhomboid family serine protease